MRLDRYERSKVFVVGGQPTVTYNPRPTLGLEERVLEYLDERGRILCITGPTKSGKTVLVRKIVPRSIRIAGGETSTADDFWLAVADACETYTEETFEESVGHDSAAGDGFSAAIKPGGIGIGMTDQTASRDASMQRHSQTRTRDTRRAGREDLRRIDASVVVDDWHHIASPVQRQIVRGIKELVFDGVRFIFVAVPHHAADAVRAESEKKGRVEQLRVTPWSEVELGQIATAGFGALNIAVSTEISQRLARESYGSPHLMQSFCLRICKNHKIAETVDQKTTLREEVHDRFFRKIASDDEVDAAYSRLAQGPRSRRDRKLHELKGGDRKDIYGVLLLALAETGPQTQLGWPEIRQALRRLMTDPPTQQQCTRVVEHMAAIAKKLVWDPDSQSYVGDPVLDYDAELGKVHITDPFFAFQLRWRIRRGRGGHVQTTPA